MLHAMGTSIIEIKTLTGVQVNLKPSYQDTGVQCELLQSPRPSTDFSIQCDLPKYPPRTSSPRTDPPSTSESELSDIAEEVNTSREMYCPSSTS